MKFGEDSTILRTSVENFVHWLANGSLPWVDYCAFMSGRLIALDKQPGVRLVGVGETGQRFFANIVLKVHRWELPVLHYHEIMVIYPYPFFVVTTQFFS